VHLGKYEFRHLSPAGSKPAGRLHMKTCSKCKVEKDSGSFYPDKRRTDGLNSNCRTCQRVASRKWRQGNPDKTSVWKRKWEKSANGKASRRDSQFRRRYGISAEQFDAMVSLNDGRCEVCKEKGARLVVDHCHSVSCGPASIRGMLCDRCNLMVGMSGDSPSLLIAAAEYLSKFADRTN